MGRPHMVLMSAALFKLLMKERVARWVEELDDDTVAAIASGAVPLEYAVLDEVVDDGTA